MDLLWKILLHEHSPQTCLFVRVWPVCTPECWHLYEQHTKKMVLVFGLWHH